MTIRYVTTCHKAGFDEYGHRLLENWHNMPEGELIWYTEGYELPEKQGVVAKDNATIEDLQSFKRRYSGYVAPDYTMDVVRFSNKVFAFVDALMEHDGLGVWVDADIIPYKVMPDGYIESLLPAGTYIALFKRDGMYSECGFWVVDCRHRGHKAFMKAMRDFYMTDAFRDAYEWHDSYLMDIAIRNLEKMGVITSCSLSEDASRHDHPMSQTEIARYLDHCKGPFRKIAGKSQENMHRV